jgi:hypothetical protein
MPAKKAKRWDEHLALYPRQLTKLVAIRLCSDAVIRFKQPFSWPNKFRATVTARNAAPVPKALGLSD